MSLEPHERETVRRLLEEGDSAHISDLRDAAPAMLEYLVELEGAVRQLVEVERANPLDWNYGPTADAFYGLADLLGEGPP